MDDAKYKVLITTSGRDNKLGEVTNFTNKVMLRVGKKPTLSYIVESYPENIPFVITLGDHAQQIKDFMELAYPDRTVTYVHIDKNTGEGSSHGYSMLSACESLQCPFIYHASDTILLDKIHEPTSNWLGGFRGEKNENYSSVGLSSSKIMSFQDKGAKEFDYQHVGVVGVHDYQSFWTNLKALHNQNPLDQTLNDSKVIEQMVQQGVEFTVKEFHKWHDTGNKKALELARKNIPDTFENLDKLDESIFLFDDFVIKFFHDEKRINERVERATVLGDLVPNVSDVKNTFYKYPYVPGDLYADVATENNFYKFLEWSEANLWKPSKQIEPSEFKNICHDFYEKKTIERIGLFRERTNTKDFGQVINGVQIPPISELISSIDFNWLCTSEQSHFHGDFILDNIIKTEDGFKLIDWRQNFGGQIETGDKYYDLAKMNHNLTVNHHVVHNELFTVKTNDEQVFVDIMRKQNLVDCQAEFFRFLKDKNLDIKKVKVLTALIWLNIAPLHPEPHNYNLFLYYFGKYNLYKALQS
jgi:hypothetical protein